MNNCLTAAALALVFARPIKAMGRDT